MFVATDIDLLYFAAMGGQQSKESSTLKRPYSGEQIIEYSADLDAYFISSPCKRQRSDVEQSVEVVVRGNESRAFLRLLGDPKILDFLRADVCRRISDKYLLAMVFTYFKRALYELHEYTRLNFFVALYLANDMEEDEEDVKYDIFPWALGSLWRNRYVGFLKKRERLWQRMGYRAVVSKKCCEEIMCIGLSHWAWERERREHHGGATRVCRFFDEDEECYVRGPDSSPRPCQRCFGSSDSGYFDETSWYLSHSSNSSNSDSSPDIFHVEPKYKHLPTFGMKGLTNITRRHDIDDSDNVFPKEE